MPAGMARLCLQDMGHGDDKTYLHTLARWRDQNSSKLGRSSTAKARSTRHVAGTAPLQRLEARQLPVKRFAAF